MKEIFPKEILDYSKEVYLNKISKPQSAIYKILLLLMVLAIGSLPFVNVDISIQADGVIRTNIEKNKIVSSIDGRIEEIRLKENSYVRKGDTVVILNRETIETSLAKNRDLLDQYSRYVSDLNSMINKKTPQTKRYKKEYSSHTQIIKDFNQKCKIAKRNYERNQRLFSKQAISKVELEKFADEYKLAKANLNIQIKRDIAAWEATKSDYEIKIRELSESRKKLLMENCKYFVCVNVDGYIQNFSGIKKGDYLFPNQEIATVSPESSLLVESYIKPSDIGYLKQGLKTKFQIHSFNYNQWGFATGKIEQVFDDVIVLNNQTYFRVRCSLDKNFLKLENGYKGKLKKGMSVSSRFYITRRSLFDLLYDKIDDWLNPKLGNYETI